jgi:small-conductance mechanosensitive channel
MHDALSSLAVLALTVVTLATTRARGVFVHILVEAVLLLAIGLFLSWHGTSPLPHFGSVRLGLAGAWYRALAIVWWLIGARLAVNVTAVVRGRNPRSRQARLFSDLSAAVIYITAILIILNSVLDLNINGLLATSGVIAIVLGLALQNTLADVFSGIAVGLEQPFHVGDRVSLGDNVEGVIVQLNWRSVRIQTDGEDLATIPNSIVAKGQIINHSVPTRRRASSIQIMAPVDVSAATVFELMRQATLLTPNLLASPAPSITMLRSGLRSSTYATSFFVADSPGIAAVRSILLCQTRRLFRHAGIGSAAAMSSVELLGAIVMFESLSGEQLRQLAANVIDHVVEPGDTIFEQGSASTSVYAIAAGVMEISREDPDAKSETIGHIGPGEYIGEIGLTTGSPRAVTMTALTHGHVLEIPGTFLCDLLKSNKALNAAMERSVRRGMALLDRDDAARVVHPIEETTDLFARIKLFFGLADPMAGIVQNGKGN